MPVPSPACSGRWALRCESITKSCVASIRIEKPGSPVSTPCAPAARPIISVDSKKKELIGPFKNPGVKWDREAERVKDHDFRSEADALATPYGIYDLNANCGTVFVGTSHHTPGFAVDCIEKWRRTEGRKRYPGATELHILADTGGSNGCTCRAFKHGLQHRLCSRHGITVNVCHYPTGTSRWNPIEHRLFSEISKNWAARPLDTIDTMLRYIRTTTTQTGLTVRAHLVRKQYAKGVKVPDLEMKALNIISDRELPRWNYRIEPA